jgi:hypothetical protein
MKLMLGSPPSAGVTGGSMCTTHSYTVNASRRHRRGMPVTLSSQRGTWSPCCGPDHRAATTRPSGSAQSYGAPTGHRGGATQHTWTRNPQGCGAICAPS